MITFPRTAVPVPDAVAALSASSLPPKVRDAIAEAGLAGRLLAGRVLAVCPQGVRFEAASALHTRLATANKLLAAHNPRLVHSWADLPGLNR
ncbi:hypothetical protein [Streptomyces sp. NRRL B-24720]|uniref:hypothetical protein n=1 Tax=Streptomyces sp. NRRL B-24720 TaxID=1476876 RepID=UPI0004C6F138|nr:hypothetical protein [Streptomyces sp. NRRL B-24720]